MIVPGWLRPVKPREVPPKELAREILDRQYAAGLEVLRTAWAADVLQRMEAECPHLTHEEMVRCFSRRQRDGPESAMQAALFLEWNARNRRKRRTRKSAAPARVRQR